VSAPQPGWYLRRLRRMSPAEVRHRVQDQARRQAWGRRQVHPGETPPLPAGVHAARSFGQTLPAGTQERVSPAAACALVAAADRVLAGRWTVLGVTRDDSADPDWFRDPLTGRRAPDRELAFRVHHRDENETGNIKQVWEMSRHHHITVLAAAWWLTEDPRYAEAAAAQLRSWWRANPFLSGVHWTSGIEVGVRLLSWVWTRRLLDTWPKVGDLFENDDDAVRQIAWHQEFLAAFPSRGSSANNHVLAEAAGALAGACAFPWFAETGRWRTDAADLLERELAHNTFPSGLNRELATDYHRFVIELVLCAALEADGAGAPLAEGTWHRLRRMLDAGAGILDVAGRPPRQGDGDEGRGLVVDDPDLDPWAAALGSGAAVLGAPAWWPAFEGGVQAAVLGGLGTATGSAHGHEAADVRPARFRDAGCVILRSLPADGPEIWARGDAGPHGFLSIAAHAHADALSLELRHDGVELFVDPGTYCYHGEPKWREYFRSTAAHNTLELAGLDQSVSGGPFLWTEQARTELLAAEVGDVPVQTWVARHDGYRRLSPPAIHRRSARLDSPGRTLTVRDTLETSGTVSIQLAWHLGPDVEVRLEGTQALLSWTGRDGAGRHGAVDLPGALEWSLHRGAESPPLGWYSPGFARKVPAPSLIGRGSGSSRTELVTTVRLP
jgi:hypothetical protein